MKNLLKNIFGIFAGLIFAVTLTLVIPCYFIIFQLASEKKAPHLAHRYISRSWAKLLFIPFFGIRLKITGKEKLDKTKTYVFIANHRSQLDIPAYAISTEHTFRFLAKEELTRIPLLGFIIRNLYISVNRKDKAARIRSMDRMKQSLDAGVSVFICPEGTRNTTDRPLLDFHDGAFRLAIAAQVPLAVMAIVGSDQLLSPRNPLALSPGKMYCHWADPIDTKGMTEKDVPALKDKAVKIMLKLLQQND